MQGVTTVLYPLSVVKTQQMAIADAPRGLRVRRQWLLEATGRIQQQHCRNLTACVLECMHKPCTAKGSRVDELVESASAVAAADAAAAAVSAAACRPHGIRVHVQSQAARRRRCCLSAGGTGDGRRDRAGRRRPGPVPRLRHHHLWAGPGAGGEQHTLRFAVGYQRMRQYEP